MKKEIKSGMYGEMPVIKIGKYHISEMSNLETCSSVWIKDTEADDAAEFKKESLFKIIDEFYKKHF